MKSMLHLQDTRHLSYFSLPFNNTDEKKTPRFAREGYYKFESFFFLVLFALAFVDHCNE